MTAYQAITTCNEAQWAQYGRAMATTFARHWPPDVELTVYAEGFSGEDNGQVKFADLDQAAPWLAPWKAARTKDQRGYIKGGRRHFRWDAVRFSHKIAAIGAAAETASTDVLIWLDADIVTHSPVTVEWLSELFPAPAAIAWLDRVRTYPECGFLMFRLPNALPVIQDLVYVYQSKAIFEMQEWHDSFVIQRIVNAAVAKGEISVASLSGKAGISHHPFVAGPLGSRMDHLKGSRKTEGRSRPADLLRPRPEPYWQSGTRT